MIAPTDPSVDDPPPLSRVERAALGASGATFLGTLAALAINGADLPKRVPIHFGVTGVPDGWADRSSLVLLLVVLVPLNVLLFAAQRMGQYKTPGNVPPRDPAAFYAATRRTLTLAQTLVNVTLCALIGLCILVGNGALHTLPTSFLLVVFAAFGVVIFWVAARHPQRFDCAASMMRPLYRSTAARMSAATWSGAPSRT